jgi:peptidoglycan/LPS O-acetylase OafA/YrhL
VKREPGGAFYKPELDALRFFAFLAVLIHHTWPWTASGYPVTLQPSLSGVLAAAARAGGYGVDLFFCLSAYLITSLLIREVSFSGRLNVVAFWIRRALRIWPLYFAFVAAAFAAGRWSESPRLPREYLPAFLCFGANWAFALRGLRDSIVSPLWSVSIEEQFYLLWPLALSVVSWKRAASIAWGLLACALCTRVWLAAHTADHVATWFNSFARLDPIAAGILLATAPRALPLRPRMAWAAAAMAGCVAVQFFFPFEIASPWSSIFTYSIVAVCCAVMLQATIGVHIGDGPAAKALIYAGKISYGLYVYHYAAIKAVNIVRPAAGFLTTFAAAFVLTAAAAVLSYELFERHFLQLKRRFTVVESRPV